MPASPSVSAVLAALTMATLAGNTALAQQMASAPADIPVIGDEDRPTISSSEPLPEINWDQVSFDAYDLTRSAKARELGRQVRGEGPVWNRTENTNGSANVTVKRSLRTTLDTKVGVDMVVAPSSAQTLPGAQQQASSGAAWASTALPSFGPWWDQASVDARLDPTAEQGRLATSVSKSLPLNDRISLTLQSGLGVNQSLASSSLGGASSHTIAADRSAKLSWQPTGTSVIAQSRLSAMDDRWLNSFAAEQSLFGGVSVRGTVSQTESGGHDQMVTAGFRRSW